MTMTRETAKADCEAMLNELVPFAERWLLKHGEFFPFGGAMKANSEIVYIAGYDGRERPPSDDIIDLLKKSFRSGAASGEYKATALVYDVRVLLPSSEQKSDAVAVALDHRNSYSTLVLLPYQLKNGSVVFGESFANKGDAYVFKSR
jgi:hypothetical protein